MYTAVQCTPLYNVHRFTIPTHRYANNGVVHSILTLETEIRNHEWGQVKLEMYHVTWWPSFFCRFFALFVFYTRAWMRGAGLQQNPGPDNIT